MYKQIMRYKIKKPKGLNSVLSRLMAREAIKTIIDRTMSGRDVNGDAFTSYSDAYKSSEEFEDWGKTNKVNLRLTGDMQESLRIDRITDKEIIIGFTEELEAAKAHGHQTGANRLPRRVWFGLNPSEENSLVAKYESLQNSIVGQDLDELLRPRTASEETGVFLEVPEDPND